MAAVSDEYMITVLRPFVAATGPVLRGLRDADPFRLGRLAHRRGIELEGGEPVRTALPAGTEPTSASSGPPEVSPRGGRIRRVARAVRRGARRGRERGLDRLATSKLPGTPRWQVMTPAERDDWWVGRVGRFTSAVASIPGVGGALARRLPVSDIIGLAAQGLVVCAIAGEHGMTGRDDQVRLLGDVLFRRELDPAAHGDPHTAEVDREAAELTGGLDAGEPTGTEHDGRLVALAKAVWRMGRSLMALHSELERRPQGRWFWRTLANLPVVGVFGAYKSERSGLMRAARRTAERVASSGGRRR